MRNPVKLPQQTNLPSSKYVLTDFVIFGYSPVSSPKKIPLCGCNILSCEIANFTN